MEKDVYQGLIDRVEEIEKRYLSIEDFVKSTTNFEDKHRLRIEDISSHIQELQEIYDEFSELEIAELLDYQNLYGRFDGDNHKAW